MDNVYHLDDFDDSDDEPIKTPIQQKFTLKSLWVEKYRPKTLEDLMVDDGVSNKVQKIIDAKMMPNLIITGLPGIGKTTTTQCIAKHILGPYYKNGILEINASDDRGIKFASELIENFCKQTMVVKKEDKGVYANHKIILLEEADNMTLRAQQFITKLMDEYPNSIRFAITCNNSSDIIEALQTRCLIMRYKRVPTELMIKRLEYICKKEGVEYTMDGLESIVAVSQGDLRQAINNLQSTNNGHGAVTMDNVYKLCDKPHPLIIENILKACGEKDFHTAIGYLNDLRSKGYSSADISMGLVDSKAEFKIQFMEEISKTNYMINRNKGINSPVQLTGCIAALCRR